MTATWEVLPNKTLARIGELNATMIGAPPFSGEDQKFGEQIMKSMGIEVKEPPFDTTIAHADLSRTFPNIDISKASTDVGNVSWMLPTLTFSVATKAKGTPQHSWLMVSQTNSPPAMKGGLTASKWMVASALDCLIHPEIISDAWEKHKKCLAQNIFYHPILNDVKVPGFKDLYGIEPAHIPILPAGDE